MNDGIKLDDGDALVSVLLDEYELEAGASLGSLRRESRSDLPSYRRPMRAASGATCAKLIFA